MRKIKPKTLKEAKTEMSSIESYPHFGIELEYLPEAKKWEIGKTYNLGLELKMNGLNIDETKEGEFGRASFEIRGIEVSLKGNRKSRLEQALGKLKK